MNYLDRNEFNFKPSQLVVDTIKNFDLSKFAFYTRIYDQGKKSIFSVFLSEQFQIDEQQVLLGYGAEDLLKKAVHFFLTEEGSNKIMMIPKFSWWYYANIAAEVNGKTLQYNVIETDDTFKYDFDSLERQVNEVRPKILLVATPNNPTGNGLTPTELEHLCDIVPKETIILVDEAYASYVTSDTLYIKHLVETRGNIVFCRTLSKFYGLPGLRLGFGFIGKGDAMEHFAKYANMYLGYDRLSEEVGIAALKSSDHYREIARVMQAARDMYTKEIGRLNGFKVYKSVANFILIKYPIHLKEKLQQAFADEEYKVKFMNEPDLNTHMRITLGRAEQNRTICDTILRIAHQ